MSVELSQHGHVAVVTLNNPSKRNALTAEVARSIAAAGRDLRAALDQLPAFAELAEIHVPGKTEMPRTIQDWRPEDAQFWAEKGRRIARRNLWLSIPALTLAFAVWMVWSVVIARLPAIGFSFSQDQLFWLA
mgnify:CR=1 FL=1